MEIIVAISQAILYVGLAVLMGTFVLQIINEKYRPSIYVPQKWITIAIFILPIVTFIPIINVLLYISPQLGILNGLGVILTTYTVGLAWACTLLFSCILLVVYTLTDAKKVLSNIIYIILLLIIIATIGWGSHAGAMNVELGIISDSLHLIGVSIWVGIILVIAKFHTNTNNWLKFLSWFTVTALTCFGVIAVSGFLLLDVLVTDYVDSWLVSYGQGLFIKHLLIIPLFLYAAFNGIFVKYKLTVDPSYNVIKGIKLEAVILLTIFIITAFFTQSSPPNGAYLNASTISPLYKLFHDVTQVDVTSLKFVTNGIAVAFVFASLVLLIAQIVAILKKAPNWLLLILSFIFVFMIYATFMLSVVIV